VTLAFRRFVQIFFLTYLLENLSQAHCTFNTQVVTDRQTHRQTAVPNRCVSSANRRADAHRLVRRRNYVASTTQHALHSLAKTLSVAAGKMASTALSRIVDIFASLMFHEVIAET